MILLGLLVAVAEVVCAVGHLYPILPRIPLKGEKPQPGGSVWPQPHSMQTTLETLSINPHTFKMSANLRGCDVIDETIRRYQDLLFFNEIFTVTAGKVLEVLRLDVTSRECEKYPHETMDEKYHINISVQKSSAVVRADSVWGIVRGLETFSQLIYQNANFVYIVNATRVRDTPRFSHRGILLDSARHFVSKKVILANLDAMTYNKMNVFHWHLTDDQSFPYQSTTFPEMSRKGAFSPQHVYTQEDVAEIIEYARLRGIRVIPEFESPGHTLSWGNAHKDLLTPCYGDGVDADTANFTRHSAREILNPTLNNTYKFIEELYKELSEVFRDRSLHLGLSEVGKDCWKSNPNIWRYMRSHGVKSYHDLERLYAEKLLGVAVALDKHAIVWQDLVENGKQLKGNPTVQVWKDAAIFPGMKSWKHYMATVVKIGHRAILSSCWYLNMISYRNAWKEYYTCDPQDFPGSHEDKERIVGGEACLWGTFVDDTNLMSRLWPRASAVAERLWSKKSVNDTEVAKYRLDDHRCRMLNRGISAQPIFNGFCDQMHPFKPSQGINRGGQGDLLSSTGSSGLNMHAQLGFHFINIVILVLRKLA